MGARTMLFEVVDKLGITVHGVANPSDQEWDALLAEIQKLADWRGMRVIVFSRGGGPDVRQRRRLVASMKGIHPPTVLLTDSVVARGIATAMTWFRRDLKVFPTTKRAEAFRELGLADGVAAKANATIERFLRELGES
jgi:hypothetical protein